MATNQETEERDKIIPTILISKDKLFAPQS